VFDRCANSQVLKCLTIVDEYTRECLAITVSGRIRSADVIEQLSRLISLYGAPRHLRSDNGTEFVSHAVLKSPSVRIVVTSSFFNFKGAFRNEH